MDQLKIGGFIAACRRQAGFTQAALAERLGVTDRAVSKWERGKCLPDASIMLPLCALLGITVNELLSGERLDMENYREMAEKNLMALKEQEERFNKRLLDYEWVIGLSGSVSYMLMLFAACFATESLPWRVALIGGGLALLIMGAVFALRIEQQAGYYECPRCGERVYQRKVLTK